MAAVDYDLAKSICEAIYEFDKEIILLGLSNSQMIKAANDIGIRCAREVFADRAYEDNGSLVDRSKDGSFITDENLVASRVIEMIKNKRVKTITGKYIDIEVDSICVHGDSIKALEFVKTIKNKLENENIKIAPLNDIVKI